MKQIRPWRAAGAAVALASLAGAGLYLAPHGSSTPAPSAPDSQLAAYTAPSAPGCLTAAAGTTARSVKLDWPDVPGATKYQVWEDRQGARARLVATVTASEDTTRRLTKGTHRYHVTTVTPSGTGTRGPELTVSVPVAAAVSSPGGCSPTTTATPVTTTTPPSTSTAPPPPTTTTKPPVAPPPGSGGTGSSGSGSTGTSTTSTPPAGPVTTSTGPGSTGTAPGAFPTAASTGVPSGTALSAYTGPCTVTTPNTVIDAKTITCDLVIQTTGVTISRSMIKGSVDDSSSSRASFTISDSEINVGSQPGTGIGDSNFTATRVHVHGGNRGINCYVNCTVQNSYVHGQFTDTTGTYHESAIRMGSGSTIRGNTIACDAPDVPPDAGCSADLTGYGDFAVVQNNLIQGNLFKATTGGFCGYGGSTTGKPYSSGVNNVRFLDNVFERGAGGKCGYWGAVTSFDSGAPGNRWSNNTWTDGTAVAPSN